MGMYERAGFTAQMPITRPRYTKTVQIQNNITQNTHNKNYNTRKRAT